MNHGRLAQLGTPREIYDAPATRFVAEFVGAANLLEGEAARRLADGAACALIRPERIRLGPETGARAAGTVADSRYFGSFVRLRVQVEGASLAVDLGGAGVPPPNGTRVGLYWDAGAIHRIENNNAGPAPVLT
jgi:putative spermidine/putrescine transport system ATP-binding protein